MIKDVVMPKAGLTMVEGTIVEWIAAEGSQVKKGDALMEYENEKSVQTCDALNGGILHITAQAGETIPIGEKIGALAETQAEYDSLLGGTPEAAPEKGCARECPECVHQAEIPAASAEPAAKDGHVRASGLARKMAAEAGINLADVPAPNGRVQKKDIEAYLKAKAAAPAPAPAAAIEDETTEIPWVGVKKTIAANMLKSIQTTAQCTCMREVDVTDFLALRGKFVACADTLGCRVSVNDLLCKLLAKVLPRHPLANATFDGKKVTSYKHVHLSVGVATENGLMVPVLRNADTLTLTEIHNQVKALAEQAKNRTLPSGSQSGGTCTITNFGVFPIDFSTPVINLPQTCIVGFGRPSLKPAVLPDGSIGARQMMHVVFTFDHQVIDGLEVGRIFEDIETFLKTPELILA